MDVLTYDPNILFLDLGDERMSAKQDVEAEALWHGIPIEGFSSHGEEMIRSAISRVPPELLQNVHCVKAAPELQPKHGRYDPETHTVNINPLIFNLMQRFGKGQGWIYHTELCVVHEIGHSIYYFLPEKEKDEWRDISGWMIGTQEGQAPAYDETRPGWPHGKSKWTHRKGIGFTRKYAKKNDDEDFADSFAFYILSKPFQMEPAKREFIDKLIKERVKKYPTVAVDGPVKAYGTSEGLEKAWDTRGRGRHPKFTPKTIDELIPERPSFPKMVQPSKEPGYVGPTEDFYHGTISENLASIIKKGLEQNSGQKFNVKLDPFAPGTLKSANGFVYLTKDRSLAEWYALVKQRYMEAKPDSMLSVPYSDSPEKAMQMYKPADSPPPLPGSKPAIVTLEIPMSEEKNFQRDPKSPGMPAWMVKGKIPAKYLSQIEVLDANKSWKPWWTKAQGRIGAERTVPVYLVFYGPTAHIALVLDTKS